MNIPKSARQERLFWAEAFVEQRDISALAAPLLVVAPHPDDETLGCGGAIALLRSQQQEVRILVVSDGTQSHPNSKRYPKPVLCALRQRETLRAMEILGVPHSAVSFLNLPDAAVPQIGSLDFPLAVQRCQISLASLPPLKTILVPWRNDPHADHRATYQLIKASADPLVRIVEYPIWAWDHDQVKAVAQADFSKKMPFLKDPSKDARVPSKLTFWRLDTQSVLALKRQAIDAYRSQTTNLIDDDPEGFRLSPQMLQNFQVPWEFFVEEVS